MGEPGPVDFSSKNGSERVDKAMLAIVQGIDGEHPHGKGRPTGEQLSQLDLKEEGIAKVGPFSPANSKAWHVPLSGSIV